jgi:hypothetical protein
VVSCSFSNTMSAFFQTIHELYNQFNNDGSALKGKHHQPSSVHSLENIDTVTVPLQRSPTKSTRKGAAQLGISRWSLQRILKSDVNLYPYKMTVSSKLTIQNRHQRMAFAEWANNEVSFSSVWFSDEANFHLDGVLIHKMCDLLEGASCPENNSVSHHLKSWTARANFLWTDSEHCMLRNSFVSHHLATGLPLQTQWFMQDRAGPHSECCFGLSAWHFQLACYLKPISWSFHMWTELAPR